MTTDQRVQTIVQLMAEQIEQLDRIADHLKVSRSAVIRFAVDAYVRSFILPNVATDSQNNTPVAPTEAAA